MGTMQVGDHRKKRKQELVDVLGGKCQVCGFNDFIEALDFHHINPKEKKYALSSPNCHSIESDMAEAAKCA